MGGMVRQTFRKGRCKSMSYVVNACKSRGQIGKRVMGVLLRGQHNKPGCSKGMRRCFKITLEPIKQAQAEAMGKCTNVKSTVAPVATARSGQPAPRAASCLSQ